MKPTILQRLLLGGIILAAAMQSGAGESLEQEFKNPPEATRPRCYWYWMEGNITKDGITKDLEAMQRVGIGEAYIGIIHGQGKGQPGAIKVLSEPFWEAMAHAVREGTRLGVDIGTFNSPGWSQSGGPWVKPQQAMRHMVLPETRLHGPQHFTGKLAQPAGDFQDVAVLAFPAPLGEDAAAIAAFAGKVTKEPASVTIELPQAATARSLSVTPLAALQVAAKLEASDDGKTFRLVHSFTIDRHNLAIEVGPTPLAPMVVAFPETTARVFRVVLSGPANLGEVRLSGAARVDDIAGKSLEKVFQDPLPPFEFYTWPPQPEPSAKDCAVAPDTVRDLSKNLQADGSFTWDVPAGDWIVLRAGMVPTGTINRPAAPEATGLEVDKMNRPALKQHFDAYIGKLLARLTPAERRSWKHVVADSYETGPQNWSDGMAATFGKRYGYDPTRFLPVLTGRLVGGADQSNRFLWDLRRLVADRVASEYVGGLRDLCQESGLKMWLENYGHWGFPSEFLLYGGNCDEVGGEFWESGGLGSVELRDAASAAHIYGKRQVFAEAWTGGPLFRSTPWSLKKRGDWAMCEGINQFVLHVNIHQPWQDRQPGMSAWFGTEFNRHNTWFGMSRSWIDYLRRCSFLLQQGQQVADVAYFIGEDAPKMTGIRQPALPPGHDFDYINADVLLNRARVEQGRLVLTDGMSYRVLVLPPSATMRPETLAKIKLLVDGGLTVVGPLPTSSPSLQGYPACDVKVRELSAALKGRVLNGADLNEALKLPPDLAGVNPERILFTHRRSADAEIYFLSNQDDSPAQLAPVFRVTGKLPELWHPDTGDIERPACTAGAGVTTVPLRLDARGSVFVVFRDKSNMIVAARKSGTLEIRRAIYEAVDGAGTLDVTARLAAAVVEGGLDLTVTNDAMGKDPALLHVKQLRVDYVIDGKPASVTVAENQPLHLSSGTELTGSWNVEFGPHKAVFEQLGSWTARPEPAIKYHSGEATYRTTFQAPAATKDAITMLDLGRVESLAEVTLNGRSFPVLWKPPYRLDVSSALRPGANQLAVRVVNAWHNRLVGERLGVQGLGGVNVWASALPGYAPNEPLLPAGLIGPVRLATLHAADAPPPAVPADKTARSGNPIFPGWYADPEGAIIGNQYWVFPTFSAPFDEQTHFDAFSSTDLVHWEKHPRILDNKAVPWVRRALLAPAIVVKDTKYYLFFGANDIHDSKKEVGGIGVAVADHPGGPYRDYLGKPLISWLADAFCLARPPWWFSNGRPPNQAACRRMNVAELVFTGFNRRVAALHRHTGRIVWQWRAPRGSTYVSLLLESNLLVVSVDGYMYGLDPLTGGVLWFNPMEGFGTGVTSLVSANGTGSSPVIAAAAQISSKQSDSTPAHSPDMS